MRLMLLSILTLSLGAAACEGSTAPGVPARSGNGTPASGLDVLVLRGPVTQVCRVDVPCDAPFSAGFSVNENGTTIQHFTTNTAGHALVPLAAGSYIIIPDASAPIIAPTSQQRAVTVQSDSITTVTLHFDTGIR